MLLIGLLLGAVGGWAYASFLNPVNLINIAPDQLVQRDREQYILLVSEAYLQDRDLDRARARLALLQERDIATAVTALADQAYRNTRPSGEVRALTTLAEALGGHPLAEAVFSGTGQPTSPPIDATSTPTFEGIPTITPTSAFPTETPTPFIPTATPTLPFVLETELELIAFETICEDDSPAGLIEVWVFDSLDQGIPGVRVLVEWEDQQDTFFTGMKLDINPGYADFEMQPDTRYTVTLVNLAEPVVGIESTPCVTSSDETILPTFQLVFAPGTLDGDQ